MKIGYLVTSFPSTTSSARINLIEGMANREHDVSVFASKKPADWEIEPVKEDLQENIQYLDIPQSKLKRIIYATPHFTRMFIHSPRGALQSVNFFRYGKDALNLRQLYTASRMCGGKFDIIHAHRGGPARIGSILKRAGIAESLIVSFHGYGVREARKQPQKYQHLFHTADCFLGISRHICDELQDLGVPDQKIKKHFTGIDISNIPFKYDRGNQERHDSNEIVVTTIANLKPIKGIRYGIEAIAKLKRDTDIKVEYQIVGGDPSSTATTHSRGSELLEIAERNNVAKDINFHGYVPHKEAMNILYDSDIYMLTSLEEGLATVLLEAQAVGLPIVTTRAGGTTDAVNGNARIVSPRDSDKLASELIDIIQNQHKWESIANEGREFVKANFDCSVTNERIEEIYCSV